MGEMNEVANRPRLAICTRSSCPSRLVFFKGVSSNYFLVIGEKKTRGKGRGLRELRALRRREKVRDVSRFRLNSLERL